MALLRVYGIGLSSVFGGFHDSCAAARAGLSRFSDHTHIATMFAGETEATPLSIARSADVYEGYQGAGRRVKLLISAYQDLLSVCGHTKVPDNVELIFASAAPSDRLLEDDTQSQLTAREKRLSDYANSILDPFYTQSNPSFANKPVQLVFGERIAFARLLKKAIECVDAGKYCLLMLVDSYLDEPMLQNLLAHGLAKTSDQPTGFIPGEGAACILIGPAVANQTGMDVNIDVAFESSAPQKSEPEGEQNEMEEDEIIISPDDWNGLRLYKQCTDVLPQNVSASDFPVLVSDMNGEEHRATEFGVMQTFIQRDYKISDINDLPPPAIHFGEAGLLAGVYAFSQIIAGALRGYAPHTNYIILLSEMNGRRGAIYISWHKDT